MSVLNQIMGVDEAGDKWDKSPDHIKRLCRDGKVKAVKIGKTWIMEKDQEYPKRNHGNT